MSRTYFDLQEPDRSGLAAQVGEQRRRVRERLEQVRRVVAVMSGKGGVGKSYLTAALALGAAPRRASGGVGVVDADLRSPTVARLLGASGPLVVSADGVRPAVGTAGVRVVSTDFLLDNGKPLRWREPAEERFVWRGVLEAGVLREFLGDVVWGPLDLLLVDLPPGADGVVDLAALVPGLAGAVAVTIPTEESGRSVERAMRAAREGGIPLLGVIENLSGYQCEACRSLGPLFAGDAGPRLAAEFGAPLLGRVPFAAGPPVCPAPLLEAFLGRLA